MKKNKIFNLIVCVLLLGIVNLKAQVGYHDAPYARYEADLATLVNATITPKSYAQSDLQSEASDQVCVDLSNAGASVEWTVSTEGDGLVIRYSVPDTESGVLEVFVDDVSIGTVNLTSNYAWQHLESDPNTNNNGVVNTNWKMRFDEVRYKLPFKVSIGGTLRLERQSGNIHIDFAELESIPAEVTALAGDVTYIGDGSDLQDFIDDNGGETIYLPEGYYEVNRELYFGTDNTVLKGAGMWYTEIHFTEDDRCDGGSGGLRANAFDISYSGLYLTTVRNARSCSYKAINGVYTSGSTITNVWAEHFECGAWIGQYNSGGPDYADGFTVAYCRFRNNYADGINLCKGTQNTIVEHCSFRNNGDDDMAMWSANGMECRNNTYRYNTSEHCWRSAGCAIYGGYNNKAHNLLIKDNLEVGIKVNNSFAGAGFNDNGMHEFYDIEIYNCGTFNDLFYRQAGAIDIACNNVAGTRVKNVKFSNISIIDSKNDAIYVHRSQGEGFYNLIFENITIDGTGKEYPGNNANGLTWGRGYGILFTGDPSGYGIHCNMTYANRGGNATVNILSNDIGTFSWTQACIPAYAPVITSSTTFGICDDPITFTATAADPSGNTVNYVEFFVDNVSIGQDNSVPYSIEWNNPAANNHDVKAVAHYLPSASPVTSYIQTITVADGIYETTTAPVVDGTIDGFWTSHAGFSMDIVSQGTVSSSADLSAYFKVARDATNLYILVDVTDDILRNDGSANWQKDGLELYIDMGNDKGGSYVANNDYQYSFVWDVTTPQSGVTFAQTTKAGNNGYIVEIRIPWSTLGGLPANGDFMGFDLHVEDNDSGTRNGKKAWKDQTDNAWQSTAVLGTLQIADCSNPVLSVNPFVLTDQKISFYPNPVHTSGNLQINSLYEGNYSITIKDMSGRMMHDETLTGSGPWSIGEGLLPGMYLLEVTNGSTVQAIKLIKL